MRTGAAKLCSGQSQLVVSPELVSQEQINCFYWLENIKGRVFNGVSTLHEANTNIYVHRVLTKRSLTVSIYTRAAEHTRK